MKTRILLPLALLAYSLTAVRAAEPSTYEKAKEAVKDTAHEVADATKKAAHATKEGAVKAYDKTAEVTKEAAAATKEKSKEAWTATKQATAKAADKTVEVTKEAAQATKEKTRAIVASKEELARYDTNKDGRLDDAEYAAMKAAQAKGK